MTVPLCCSFLLRLLPGWGELQLHWLHSIRVSSSGVDSPWATVAFRQYSPILAWGPPWAAVGHSASPWSSGAALAPGAPLLPIRSLLDVCRVSHTVGLFLLCKLCLGFFLLFLPSPPPPPQSSLFTLWYFWPFLNTFSQQHPSSG